jgi:uncharacterized integral membrane protein
MWLKIKVWTKVVLFSLVFLYALVFIWMNGDKTAKFWYWPKHEPEWPVLFLTMGAFLTGIIVTILLRTTFKTIGQVRELQSRSRAQRLQREVEQMKSKAAMLRTRDGAAGGGAEAAPPAPAESTPAEPSE